MGNWFLAESIEKSVQLEEKKVASLALLFLVLIFKFLEVLILNWAYKKQTCS